MPALLVCRPWVVCDSEGDRAVGRTGLRVWRCGVKEGQMSRGQRCVLDQENSSLDHGFWYTIEYQQQVMV